MTADMMRDPESGRWFGEFEYEKGFARGIAAWNRRA